MVNHDVMRLDIPVHYSLAMAEVQCLKKLIYVVSDIVICQSGVQCSKVGVVNILEDQAWCFALTITNNVQQRDDIRASGQVLENLDLSLDLPLLDGFQDFDNTFLVVNDIYAFKYLRVLSSACF